MLRNKKGFTLVELLAVIVILAIILAIAVPTISSLINNQKKSAFEAGVKMILKGADYYILQNPGTTTLPTTVATYGGAAADYTISAATITAGVPSMTIVGAGQYAGCNTGTVKGTAAAVTFTTVTSKCSWES